MWCFGANGGSPVRAGFRWNRRGRTSVDYADWEEEDIQVAGVEASRVEGEILRE